MKSKICTLAGILTALVLSGCASELLRTGKYEGAGNYEGSFAVVYQDLIFLRLKSPDPAPGQLAFWEWAGKYSIRKDGVILLDMDKETLKRWKFYYVFFRKTSGIGVEDLTEAKRFELPYRTPVLRKNRGGNAPVPYGSDGINPVYQAPVVDESNPPMYQ